MAGALRTGGWLVVEDFDVSAQPLACPDAADDDEERANRIRAGFIELLGARSVDFSLGRTLRHRLRSLGLADVRAEAYAPLALPATRALERANVAQVREGLVALGLGDDIEPHLAALGTGAIDIATPPLVTAWGARSDDRARRAERLDPPDRSAESRGAANCMLPTERAGERGLEPLITEPESAVLPITPLPTERFGSVAGGCATSHRGRRVRMVRASDPANPMSRPIATPAASSQLVDELGAPRDDAVGRR